jgi:hypothetical protein
MSSKQKPLARRIHRRITLRCRASSSAVRPGIRQARVPVVFSRARLTTITWPVRHAASGSGKRTKEAIFRRATQRRYPGCGLPLEDGGRGRIPTSCRRPCCVERVRRGCLWAAGRVRFMLVVVRVTVVLATRFCLPPFPSRIGLVGCDTVPSTLLG